MRAVFFGRLSHQADVWHGAHRLGIEGAVLFAEVDGRLIDAGITAVGDDGECVLQLALGIPHLAGRADHRRHRRIDDHIARHVKVGDALVGVDHREGRAVGVGRLDVGLDRGFLVGGQRLDFADEIAEAVAQVDA